MLSNPKFLEERNVLCPPGFSPGKVKGEQGIPDHFPKGPAFIESVVSNLWLKIEHPEETKAKYPSVPCQARGWWEARKGSTEMSTTLEPCC